MKKFLLIILCAISVACSTKITPPISIPTPPPISASAKPSLERTQQGIDRSVSESTKAKTKIEEQKQKILDLNIAINDAITEADKIKNASREENSELKVAAGNLVNILDDVKRESEAVRKKNEELEVTNKTLIGLLENAQIDGRDTLGKVIAKEGEADTLRNQNSDVGKALDQKNKEVTQVTKDNVKLEKKAASSGVYKHWVIGGISFVVLAGIGYILIRIYKPF